MQQVIIIDLEKEKIMILINSLSPFWGGLSYDVYTRVD